jgi:hypothetical protein
VEASCSISIEEVFAMREPDFWTDCAKAMELSIEGQRLIAEEVTGLIRRLWWRSTQGADSIFRGSNQRGQFPPV